MIRSYFLLVLLTIFGAFGSFFIKKSTMNSSSILRSFQKIDLYIGLSLYTFSAIINIYVLQLLPYSTVLPSSSITYIWTLYIARIFLKEKIGMMKVIGIIFIISGVLVITIF